MSLADDAAQSPAAIVDLDVLHRNIDRMARIARDAGMALRPHIKTHKTPQIARLQVAAGCRGVTVATLDEAEVMVAAGITDVFVAYPIVGSAKVARLCRLAAVADIRVAADSRVVVEGISRGARAHGVEIGVRLEVDSGMGRCGVQSYRELLALARRTVRLPNIRFRGLMGYAGQSYQASPSDLRDCARGEAAQLVGYAERLREAGFSVAELSAGATPTSQHAADMAGITELRPGTYVFSDRTMVHLGWGTLDDCALTVLATVVSRPTPSRAVLDLGTKTLTSDPTPDGDYGIAAGRPTLRVVELHEEHAVAAVPAGVDIPIGSRLRIIPNHACGVVSMFDELIATRRDRVVGRWPVTARRAAKNPPQSAPEADRRRMSTL